MVSVKAGESLNNGERAVYLATGIYRLDVIKSVGDAKPTQLNLGPDVHGFVSLLSIIKSKCNSKSNTCQLVYTNRAGYDPMISNLYYAKEQGHLAEAGHKLYIPGYEDYKFTLKDYNDVFADNPVLFTALYDHLKEKCTPLLDNQEEADQYNRKLLEKIREDNHNEFSGGSRADREDMMDMDDLFKMAVNS